MDRDMQQRAFVRWSSILALTLGLAILGGCFVQGSHSPEEVFVTWDGLEPDRWAAIWLVQRHSADVEVRVVPAGAPIPGGKPFGMPGAPVRRSHGKALVEAVADSLGESGAVVREIVNLIHYIEIEPWAPDPSGRSQRLESAFRSLQESFPGRNVPVACYMAFFDELATIIQEGEESSWSRLDELVASHDCATRHGEVAVIREPIPSVGRVELRDLLGRLGRGQKVMFVDAREPAEYSEVHIPGAVNMQIRKVSKESVAFLDGADLIIAYCIKDFRGYELARALADAGASPVAIMKPFGLAGWRSAGLPVAGPEFDDDEASKLMMACAREPDQCLN